MTRQIVFCEPDSSLEVEGRCRVPINPAVASHRLPQQKQQHRRRAYTQIPLKASCTEEMMMHVRNIDASERIRGAPLNPTCLTIVMPTVAIFDWNLTSLT